MMNRRWERITALAGIATVVLVVAALANWGNLYYTDSLHDLTKYYVQHQQQALVSQFLFLLFSIAVLTFAAGLRPILHRAEGEHHILSTLFFAGAVVTLVWTMVFASVNGGLAAVAGQSSPSEIKLIMGIEGYVDQLNFLVAGLTVGAASLAMLSGRVFARWIGWLGLLSGALYLVSNVAVLDPNPKGALAGVSNVGTIGSLLFLIWLIAISISLLRRSAAARAQETPVRTERVPA